MQTQAQAQPPNPETDKENIATGVSNLDPVAEVPQKAKPSAIDAFSFVSAIFAAPNF